MRFGILSAVLVFVIGCSQKEYTVSGTVESISQDLRFKGLVGDPDARIVIRLRENDTCLNLRRGCLITGDFTGQKVAITYTSWRQLVKIERIDEFAERQYNEMTKENNND